MERVGISAKGSTKAVQKRVKTYKSLLLASMNENRLDPSTLSPQVRIVSKYALLVTTKFNVFNRPSPPGYIKLIMRIPFSCMKRIISSFMKLSADFCKYATT